MTQLSQQGLLIMARLMTRLIEEHDQTPDHVLLDYGQELYEVVFDAFAFMNNCEYDPPIEALEFLARFHRAAGHDFSKSRKQ